MYIMIHTYMSTPKTAVAPSFPLRTQLSPPQLLQCFLDLFPHDALALWLQGRVHYQRSFTPLIVLWYLVFEHLHAQSTLDQILEDARDGGADRLSPPGKRPLSQTLLSDSTSAWCKARKRLPVKVVSQALRRSGQSLQGSLSQRHWQGMEPALLDGTTLRLRPLGDIPEHFHCHGGGNNRTPYWCLARSVVVFCLVTGVVLDAAIDSTKTSEQALLKEICRNRSWAKTLLVGDRNFGVYSVVAAARAAQAHVLVRLTEARACKLAREAGVTLGEGLDQVISWKPSRSDKRADPSATQPISGRLLVARVEPKGGRSFLLCLFTTQLDPQITIQEWVQLYGRRWQVELNLRHVKADMGLHHLVCKSADMARKRWLSGLLAYNLVRVAMSMAAARSHQPVLCLSFTRSLRALVKWLPKVATAQESASWERLLNRIAGFRQPRRKKPRPSEPRALRRFKVQFPKLIGDRAKARKKLARANSKS